MAVRSVLHWGPLVALGIIVSLASSTMYFLFYRFPGPWSLPFKAFVAVWVILVNIILYMFFKAMYTGPGCIPRGWKPAKKEDEAFLQECKICEGFKAPRSHHCHQCGNCMKKMDHHCPWINSCVGNDNHMYFVGFVSTVPIGCLQIVGIMIYYVMYHWPRPTWNPNTQRLVLTSTQLYEPIVALFSCGLALGVALAVGFLCFIQIRGIIKNRTDIESWIVEKAELRGAQPPFVFPYNRGINNNIRDVIDHATRRDGIHWAVVDGCDEYSLTREQLIQKQFKRDSAELCLVQSTPRRLCGLECGIRTFFDAPCLTGTILRAQSGDYIWVTSGTKHWAYGEKGQINNKGKFIAAVPRERGWIPRVYLRLTRHKE